ncbi:MAG: serine hydrolase [Oleiphilus sp.]|nr:MAG: serine hydrolase [Oleiphilus sp.]
MILQMIEQQVGQAGHFHKLGMNTIKVPKSLPTVTTIERSQESDPAKLGMSVEGVEAIWQSVEDLYRTGAHPGISLCMRRRGKIVMNRAIGHASGNAPHASPEENKVLMRPDTPVCYFSASKAVTALLMHMLREDKLINLHDPISFYAPEFGQRGKKNITIHQVLSHRSGVPGLPPGTPIETLWDNDKIWKLLCAAESASVKGDKLHYHALTGGYILERVVQTVTGGSIQDLLDARIRKPMKMKYFRYGIEDRYAANVADNHPTGMRPFFPVSYLIKRALGGSLDELEGVTNSVKFKRAVIPAGNIMGTAEEMSRFYQMMLNGGEWDGVQVCDPMTIRRLTQEYASIQFDRTLMLPMRYSAGLMLGGNPVGIWGKHSHASYGHIGLINKLCWADPSREVSVSLLNTGVPIIANVIPALARFLGRIDTHCSKVSVPD